MYVDDIIVTGSSTSAVGQLVKSLGKDLGHVQYFLALEVKTKNDIVLVICWGSNEKIQASCIPGVQYREVV